MLTYTKLIFRACTMALMIALVAKTMGYARGGVEIALLLLGIVSAMQNKRAIVLSCFILFPFLLTLNPMLFPLAPAGTAVNRIATLVMSLTMLLTSARTKGRNSLPLGMIVPYLACAAISSAQGYFPEISYLKLLNFAVFMTGLWLGTRNIQNNPRDVVMLRTFMIGVAIFVIAGSALTLLSPGVAYLQGLQVAKGQGEAAAVEAIIRMREQQTDVYFAGITNQSQCLGPILSTVVVLLIADMLFVEKRFAKIHAALIAVGIALLALTHSRTAMLAFLSGGAIMIFYTANKINLSWRLKYHVKVIGTTGALLLVAVAGVAQIRGGEVSRFIRKNDAYGEDSLMVALTKSRMGLLEENINDFKYNPLLGCGFQVAYFHPWLYSNHKGLILSAPIEKGLLPMMVLGEGGILGFIVFAVFMFSFYHKSARRHLYVTVGLFTLLVMSNFGEADFFSPGGIGGAKWVLCVAGGFVIDTYLLYQGQMEERMKQFPHFMG